MRKLSKEEVKKYPKSGFSTVGDLKRFLEEHKIPDDAPILIERVEDRYYDGVDITGMSGCKDTEDGIYPEGSKSEGWGVYLKKGQTYWDIKELNDRMTKETQRRKEGKEPEYPKISDEDLEKYIADLDDSLMTQYHPIWCPVFYKDDPDILFLDLHY